MSSATYLAGADRVSIKDGRVNTLEITRDGMRLWAGRQSGGTATLLTTVPEEIPVSKAREFFIVHGELAVNLLREPSASQETLAQYYGNDPGWRLRT